MKVKCIEKPEEWFPITVGKIYDVLTETGDSYRICNDRGNEESFFKHRFEVITYAPPTTTNSPVAIEKPITYKDFLASMPKSSDACVEFGLYSSKVFVYGLEFNCTTEERAEEVYAALITLFKEEL